MIGELAALGAAISWAIAPILYRKALNGTSINPLSANIVRCALNGGILLVVLLLFSGIGVLASLPLWVVVVAVVSGVFGLGIGDTLYMLGLKSLAVSRAVPLVATYPLFSLLWAVLLGHSLSVYALLGAAVIVVGIWLLASQKTDGAVNVKGKAAWLGIVACLGTAVFWSVGIILMDVAVSTAAVNTLDANYAIVTLRIAAVALFFLMLAPFVDRGRGFLKLSRKTVLLLCIGGLIANGLGWVLMNYSFLNIAESQAIPISSTSPLFAAIAGYTLFREKATVKTVLGAIAVVAGLVLIFII